MKPYLALLVILLVSWTSGADAGVNRWTPIGPEGAYVVALAIDSSTPSTVYAGTRGAGVIKSEDGGGSWATANAGMTTSDVTALAVAPGGPTTIYAGTDAGLFKSTDGGQHWAAANGGLAGRSQLTINALAIDSASPPALYAATDGGMFKTVDGGANWVSINTGLAGLTPRLIAIDPAAPSTIYLGVDDYEEYDRYGVLKSTDGGTSWTRIYTTSIPFMDTEGERVAAIVVDPRSHSRLFVALAYGELLRSADGGATWKNVGDSLPALTSLALDPASPSSLYAGSYGGDVFRSIDAGDHWAQASGGSLGTASVNAIVATPASVFAGLGSGVFRSADGSTWTALGLGVRNVSVSPFVVDPAAPSTIYGLAASGPTKTADGGKHWTTFAIPDSAAFINTLAIDPATPTTLYVGGAFAGQTKVYKTTDAGLHWTSSSNGLSFGGLQALAVAPSRSSTLYLGQAFAGVRKSVDGGGSWTSANNGLTAVGIYTSAIAVAPTDADIVYVATPPTGSPDTNAKIFKSTNGAAQWRQIPIAVSRETRITSFAFDPVVPSVMYVTFVDYSAGLGGTYKSSDGGESWTLQENTLATQWDVAIAIDPTNPARIYAATQSGVYVSNDAAASWSPLDEGLPSLDVWTIAVDPSGTVLRVGARDGLFEYKIAPALPVVVPLIEYFHEGFGHYFVTSIAGEIAKLDSGTIAGWRRTGLAFNVYDAGGSVTVPVCRFVSTAFAQKSSHFHTPFASECATVRANPDWVLEDAAAFYAIVPASDGSCPADFVPVYRVYNNGQGGAPNHRYITDFNLRAQMLADGWILEGLGADGVEMCAPR